MQERNTYVLQRVAGRTNPPLSLAINGHRWHHVASNSFLRSSPSPSHGHRTSNFWSSSSILNSLLFLRGITCVLLLLLLLLLLVHKVLNVHTVMECEIYDPLYLCMTCSVTSFCVQKDNEVVCGKHLINVYRYVCMWISIAFATLYPH